MSSLKRIMVTIPENLLLEIDRIVLSEKGNRNEYIQEAMRLYLAERKKRMLREQMKRGYLEMAQINLRLALEGVAAESELNWTRIES